MEIKYIIWRELSLTYIIFMRERKKSSVYKKRVSPQLYKWICI